MLARAPGIGEGRKESSNGRRNGSPEGDAKGAAATGGDAGLPIGIGSAATSRNRAL
jgi:hypothetical protein